MENLGARDEPRSSVSLERFGWFYKFELKRGEHARSLGLQDESWEVHNIILDEAERNVLDVYFRNQNAPPQFNLGLHSGSIATNATLANIVEPSQLGYARILMNRNTTDWPTLAFDGLNFGATGAAKVFTALATWTPVNKMFLASQASGSVGSLLFEADLGALRALISQDTLTVTPTITAKDV